MVPESCNVDLVVLKVLQVQTFHIKRGESVVILKKINNSIENDDTTQKLLTF